MDERISDRPGYCAVGCAAVKAVLKGREPSIWILVILDLANKVTSGGHPRAGGNRLAAEQHLWVLVRRCVALGDRMDGAA